jgi:ABC-type cobalamin transport system permease subunit
LTTRGHDAARLATLQGLYFLVTGIWPLASPDSFERVTGPKADFWLAQTVGILVASIGSVLLLGARRRRVNAELEVLGAASAAGLGLVDMVFALRGRIAKVYFLDAAIEGAIVVGWLRASIYKRATDADR